MGIPMKGKENHPFIFWSACFLWLTSLFAISWSLLLFLYIGDVLLLISMDMINAIVLLTGIIMLPPSLYMLYAVSHNKKIDSRATVLYCPIWLCLVCIILVATVGAALCVEKIYSCRTNTHQFLIDGLRFYRNVPKYKRFMDNLQWLFKCCGLDSFKDWFSRDWYDKIREYEWDPATNKRGQVSTYVTSVTDSVPLSCCKTGSCTSNYLMELGTQSVNTRGCRPPLYRIIMLSLIGHLLMFMTIILDGTIVLVCISANKNSQCPFQRDMDVRQLMSVKDNFEATSGSNEIDLDEVDSEESY